MSLREWMQKNHVFDKDLLRLWPQYGVNNPEIDLRNLSDVKWAECKNTLITEKRSELKDSAARQRFEKKLTKITKLWKASKKKIDTNAARQSLPKKRASESTKRSSTKRASTKRNSKISKLKLKNAASAQSPYSPFANEQNDEHLRVLMENRKLRRELSSKNGNYNRLEQDFKSYKLQKDKEIKALNNKLNSKNEEYDKLLRNYKQINQRINSKYHYNSAKEKEIDSLKEDKSTLLNDINQVMTDEQQKYEQLVGKYNQLKEINNVNEKYKLRYKREKRRQKKGGSFTQGINNSDTDEDEAKDEMHDMTQKQADYYRAKKYKPSKEKRKKARQRSEILARERKDEVV